MSLNILLNSYLFVESAKRVYVRKSKYFIMLIKEKKLPQLKQ